MSRARMSPSNIAGRRTTIVDWLRLQLSWCNGSDRNRSGWSHSFGPCGKIRDVDNSHCVRDWRNPIEIGLIPSLNRPGGNLTGITTLALELGPKRLELLHEIVPAATHIAVLKDPTGLVNAEAVAREQTAARKLGLEFDVLHASSETDFERAFATLARSRAGNSSEAKLTRRQRIRLLTRLNRLTKSNPIEAFSERGSSAHAEWSMFYGTCFARRTVDARLMGGGPLLAMTAPAITARLNPAATPSPQGRGSLVSWPIPEPFPRRGKISRLWMLFLRRCRSGAQIVR